MRRIIVLGVIVLVSGVAAFAAGGGMKLQRQLGPLAHATFTREQLAPLFQPVTRQMQLQVLRKDPTLRKRLDAPAAGAIHPKPPPVAPPAGNPWQQGLVLDGSHLTYPAGVQGNAAQAGLTICDVMLSPDMDAYGFPPSTILLWAQKCGEQALLGVRLQPPSSSGLWAVTFSLAASTFDAPLTATSVDGAGHEHSIPLLPSAIVNGSAAEWTCLLGPMPSGQGSIGVNVYSPPSKTGQFYSPLYPFSQVTIRQLS